MYRTFHFRLRRFLKPAPADLHIQVSFSNNSGSYRNQYFMGTRDDNQNMFTLGFSLESKYSRNICLTLIPHVSRRRKQLNPRHNTIYSLDIHLQSRGTSPWPRQTDFRCNPKRCPCLKVKKPVIDLHQISRIL